MSVWPGHLERWRRGSGGVECGFFGAMGWERSEIPFWIVKFEGSFSPESGDFEVAVQWKSSVQERGLDRAHKFRKFGRLCLKLRNGYYHRGVSLRREGNFPYTHHTPPIPTQARLPHYQHLPPDRTYVNMS